MRLSPGKAFGVAVAALAGPAVAVALAAGGGPQLPPVTIGSTTGMPSGTVSPARRGTDCTYVPYSGANTPELLVPLDGTITSFGVNAGSSGTLELRVLEPASGGQFTAVATSPPEMATAGTQSFAVSIPVKAGEVLAVDNSSDQLLFDTTSGTTTPRGTTSRRSPIGATAPFTGQMPYYRLLVSATILPNPTTTTISTTTRSHSTSVPPAGAQPRRPDAQDLAPGHEAGDDLVEKEAAARRDHVRVRPRSAGPGQLRICPAVPRAQGQGQVRAADEPQPPREQMHALRPQENDVAHRRARAQTRSRSTGGCRARRSSRPGATRSRSRRPPPAGDRTP